MKQRILIIDDSIVNINALNMMLREEYQVYVAKNGRDGIKQAMVIQPSLILLDILMPEMDGFEVLEHLMEDSNTSSIPVMFITSLNDDKNEEKGLNLGAVDYITKPFNPSVIKAKVRNHIELFLYRKTIENIALLDGLTSIPNRRSYNDKVKAEWEAAIAEKEPISIAIIDIDCFKEYNDNYGHLQGDLVLRNVAKCLEDCLPSKDGYLARYGGEEFVVILKGYNEKQAFEVLEKMRKGVQELEITHIHSRAMKMVTISVGGNTIRPTVIDDLHQFVESVDRRLYRAKSLGRNRIVWEDQIETRGQVEVFLFGNLKVLAQDGCLTVSKNYKKKVWYLFIYLITNRFREYSKQDMIDAIWPYGDVEDPNYELRVLIEELKTELEVLKLSYLRELIITINGVYRWNNNYMCIVDAEIFENLCKEATLKERKHEKFQLYLKAIELYQHDFLYKISAVKWVGELQKWYRNRYLEALSHVLKEWYDSKNYNAIISLCEKDLYREEFDEDLHYFYLLALIGSRHLKEALEHYEYIVESYYSILGVAPPDKIADLYLEIMNDGKEKQKDLHAIRQAMKENSVAKGAYYCDYHTFKNIYQLEARGMIRTGKMYYLGLLTIKEKDRLSGCVEKLKASIQASLRIGDTFSKYSESQFILLLPSVNYEIGVMVIHRILEQFHQQENMESVAVGYDLVPVEPAQTP